MYDSIDLMHLYSTNTKELEETDYLSYLHALYRFLSKENNLYLGLQNKKCFTVGTNQNLQEICVT